MTLGLQSTGGTNSALQHKGTDPNWQTGIMLCHMAAVCCAIKAEGIHGCVEMRGRLSAGRQKLLTDGDMAWRDGEKSSLKSAI